MNSHTPEQPASNSPAAPSGVVCSDGLEHPAYDPETRLEELTAKIQRGEGLTMAERIERQGIIFNHHGNISKIKIQIV
jgi:hypothetical protein